MRYLPVQLVALGIVDNLWYTVLGRVGRKVPIRPFLEKPPGRYDTMSQAERVKELQSDKRRATALRKRNTPTGSRYYILDHTGKEVLIDYAKKNRRSKTPVQMAKKSQRVHHGVRGSDDCQLDRHKSEFIPGHSNPNIGHRFAQARSRSGARG